MKLIMTLALGLLAFTAVSYGQNTKSNLKQVIITPEHADSALDEMTLALKYQGIELTITNKNRVDDRLDAISGTIKLEDGTKGEFEAESGFERVTIVYSVNADGKPENFSFNVQANGAEE